MTSAPLSRPTTPPAADPAEASILFFTSALRHHEIFAPLYMFFAALSNPRARFEFIVDGPEQFSETYGAALDFVAARFGVPYRLQDISESDYVPKVANSYRFIMPPKTHADYVYIGDIDILIVEDVLKIHAPIFHRGLPYSNIVRKGPDNRMSGLHLTPYDNYYPLPDIGDIVRQYDNNDEQILYRIVERRGHLERQPEIDAVGVRRPVHGIHMSLNRLPFFAPQLKINWGINWRLVELTDRVFADPAFADFLAVLPHESRAVLANVYFIVKGAMAEGSATFQRLTQP
jgi:hypothetical protein